MKKFYFTTLALLTLLSTNSLVFSQNCNAFFPIQENTLLEYTNYDKKEKEEGKMINEIISTKEIGEVLEIQVQNTTLDKKGEIVSEGPYYVTCEDGKLSIDLSARFQEVFDNIRNMEESANVKAEFSGTDLIIPDELIPGSTLPDANMEATVNAGPMKFRTFVNVTNRKVESKDRVETPAGIFDCYKISSEIESKTMGMSVSTQSVEWIAEGIGMIKTESYNKNGKLMGSTVLTRLEQ